MEELVPSKFLLSQNFPNPFKEITKIKYCLPVKIKVKLTVFREGGENVKELVNKIQKAGTYEFKFASYDLPDGIYNYQLQAVDLESNSRQVFFETKKMILLR